MVTGEQVAMDARQWIGTPYRHQGRTRSVAVDCAGLVIGVAHDLGLSEFDIDGYPRVPDGVTMAALLRQHMVEVDVNEIRVGDVVHIGFQRFAQHLALITRIDPTYITHAHEPNGRVVEHRMDTRWRRRVRAAYRFRGVEI